MCDTKMSDEIYFKSGEGFKTYYQNFRNSVAVETFKNFGQLSTDEERIRFVYHIPEVLKLKIDVLNADKDIEESKLLKEKGNKFFQTNDFKSALETYTQSILRTPFADSTRDLSIVLANRSASLYYMKQFHLAIKDIDYVLSLDYPRELLYKVLERKARCLLASKNYKDALKAFQETLKALDESNLQKDKRRRMETDVQIMIGILNKEIIMAEKRKLPINGLQDKEELDDIQLSKSCTQVLQSSEMGRYVSAKRDLEPGEIIIHEEPYCCYLLNEYSKTNCLHCFKRTNTPYPCQSCSQVIFCTLECKEKAMKYHSYECTINNLLEKTGVSVTVKMALRIITQNSLSFFLDLKDKLKGGVNSTDGKEQDYLKIYNLVRHENLRTSEDFFERTIFAVFLLRCLMKVNYFPSTDELLTEEKSFIGSLILRHLQILQFNAHEIFELHTRSGQHIDTSQSVFIGGGIYPNLSLFNHSCDPGIIRYFNGTSVIGRTIRKIKKGEMVAENYGPIYTETPRDKRRSKLKSTYWFNCNCVPCVEDWPLFNKMDKKTMRFRCHPMSTGTKIVTLCDNIIEVPINTANIMVECCSCRQSTNILKGLKMLQDTDTMFRQASKDQEMGNYAAALDIYLEILRSLDKTLAPPFQSYTVCQQAIRKCMLTLGNKVITV